MSRLNGGVVGYGRKTATAELLDKLRGKNVTFTTRAFAEVDIPVRKLLASRSEIQFAMTDTAFAEARVLEDDSDKLASVRLCDWDYPDPKNPFDEYAVAVEQSETELLNAVNDTIRVLKSDKINGLDQILEDAATKRFPKVAKEKLRPLYKSECSGDPTKEPERTDANAL
jgi:ABC-type amino acid transport substrate-binding protein